MMWCPKETERLMLANKTNHVTDSCNNIVRTKRSVIHGKWFIIVLMLLIQLVSSQSPVFLVHPESITAIDGSTVQFSCTANNTDDVGYRVNDTSATQSSVISKGFNQPGAEDLGSMGDVITRRNLSVSVSSLYNNTEILCRAVGTNNINSNTVILTVQGPLSSVGGLSYSFINSSTVNITWSPPFTLPGTNIIGYNISVAINGSNRTEDFTSDNYYILSLTNITDSPCDVISITVSGYNGLDGDTNKIRVPSSELYIPVSTIINSDLMVTVSVNFTDVCPNLIPSILTVLLLNSTTNAIVNSSNITVPSDTTSVLPIPNAFIVEEDQNYTISLSLDILGLQYELTNTTQFDTYGIRHIEYIDTPDNIVKCICHFAPFSTDTSCRVLLTSSTNIQYTATFNRADNIAKGNITGVITGIYRLIAFDDSSKFTVVAQIRYNVQIIGEPPSIMTSSSSSSSSSITTTSGTTTTQTSPIVSPSIDKITTDPPSVIPIVIGVIIGIIIILVIASVLLVIIVYIIVWRRNKKDSDGCAVIMSYDDIDLTTVPINGTDAIDGDGVSKEKSPPSYSELKNQERLETKKSPVATYEFIELEDVTEMPRQHGGGGDTLPQYYDEIVRMPNDSNGIVDWRSKLVLVSPNHSRGTDETDAPSEEPQYDTATHCQAPIGVDLQQNGHTEMPQYSSIIPPHERRPSPEVPPPIPDYSPTEPQYDTTVQYPVGVQSNGNSPIPQYSSIVPPAQSRELSPEVPSLIQDYSPAAVENDYTDYIISSQEQKPSPEIPPQISPAELQYDTTVHYPTQPNGRAPTPQYSCIIPPPQDREPSPEVPPLTEPQYDTTVHYPTQPKSHAPIPQYSCILPPAPQDREPSPEIPPLTEPQYDTTVHFPSQPKGSSLPQYSCILPPQERKPSPEVPPQIPSIEPQYDTTVRYPAQPKSHAPIPQYSCIIPPQDREPSSDEEEAPPIPPYCPQEPEYDTTSVSTQESQYCYASIATTIPRDDDIVVVKNQKERPSQQKGKTIESFYSLATQLPSTGTPQYEDVKPLTRQQQEQQQQQQQQQQTTDDTIVPPVPPPISRLPLSPSSPPTSSTPPVIPTRPSRNPQLHNHNGFGNSSTRAGFL